MTSSIDPVDLAARLIACLSITPARGEVFDLLEFGNILKPYESASDALRDFSSASNSSTQGGTQRRG